MSREARFIIGIYKDGTESGLTLGCLHSSSRHFPDEPFRPKFLYEYLLQNRNRHTFQYR